MFEVRLLSELFYLLKNRTRSISFFATVLGLILLRSPLAWAACGTASVGSVCQPVISAIDNPTATSIAIHWLPGGGVPPQSVKLVKGGSAARGFLDGEVLVSAAETSSLGQYSSYALTVINLGPNTTLSPLYVVGIWGSSSLPSAAFAASTIPPAQTTTTPSITAATISNGVVALAWNAGSKTYDFYNVRWSSGTAVSPNANQDKVDGGSANGSYSTKPSAPGPYTFVVEGCISNLLGLASSTCSAWSKAVTLTLPVPPVQPPTQVFTKSYNFATDHKGDCTLQNATLSFRSNGTVSFAAQVKTDHTHSGDYWHINISVKDAAGNAVHNPAIGQYDTLGFQWTSMRMSDDHGFYNWTYTATFDPRWYSFIGGAYSTNSC